MNLTRTPIFKIIILLSSPLIIYALYYWFHPFIHSALPLSNIDNLSPWFIWFTQPYDGIELYVMTGVVPIVFLITLIISEKVNTEPQINKIILWIILPICILWAFYLFTKNDKIDNVAIIITLSFFLFLIILFRGIKYIRTNHPYLILFPLFIILGMFVSYGPSLYNYGFFIGPANKLLQGELPGTFFMQYNFVTTALFSVFQAVSMSIYEIHLFFIIVLSFYLIGLIHLSRKLFQNKSTVIFFIIVIIIIRVMTYKGCLISLPQVSPLRMELWLPLLIIVLRRGFFSFFTSLSFCFIYMMDDVFGFFYLCIYCCLMIAQMFKMHLNMSQINKSLKYLVFPFLCLVMHFIIFHSFSSQAGTIYSKYHIGFLPIKTDSAFWLILFGLNAFLFVLIKDGGLKKEILIFLYLIVCAQLIYFYGRSHENNLNNISSVLILVAFLVIDRVLLKDRYDLKGVLLLVIIVSFVGFLYNKTIKYCFIENIQIRRQTGIIQHDTLEPYIDTFGIKLKQFKTSKIIILSDYDGYINYRLGYKQIGFYVPFTTTVKNDETVNFLYSKYNESYKLIVFPADMYILNSLDIYNKYLNNIDKNKQLIADTLENKLIELRFVEKL